jgi:hypothetical protein
MKQYQIDAIKKILVSKKEDPEIIQRTMEFIQGLTEYMGLKEHDPDCHCYRCMSEFNRSAVSIIESLRNEKTIENNE